MEETQLMENELPRPKRFVTTQAEIDRARESIESMPEGTLTPEQHALAIEATERLGRFLTALKSDGATVDALREILNGDDAPESGASEQLQDEVSEEPHDPSEGAG
jgi:hypothetical protein